MEVTKSETFTIVAAHASPSGSFTAHKAGCAHLRRRQASETWDVETPASLNGIRAALAEAGFEDEDEDLVLAPCLRGIIA